MKQKRKTVCVCESRCTIFINTKVVCTPASRVAFRQLQYQCDINMNLKSSSLSNASKDTHPKNKSVVKLWNNSRCRGRIIKLLLFCFLQAYLVFFFRFQLTVQTSNTHAHSNSQIKNLLLFFFLKKNCVICVTCSKKKKKKWKKQIANKRE